MVCLLFGTGLDCSIARLVGVVGKAPPRNHIVSDVCLDTSLTAATPPNVETDHATHTLRSSAQRLCRQGPFAGDSGFSKVQPTSLRQLECAGLFAG